MRNFKGPHQRKRLWYRLSVVCALQGVALFLLLAPNAPVSKAGATQPFLYNITPFLNCVEVDNAAGTMTAYFGYESFEPDAVQIPVGADNRFVPAPANRNQPTMFYPGLHERAFKVNLSINGALWLLNGFGVPAQTSSTQCPATSPTLFPLLDSLTYNASTREVTAVFGYFNAESNTIVAQNVNNYLKGASSTNLPTSFAPGLHRNAFTVVFNVDATPAVTWVLHGQSVTATPPAGSLPSSPPSVTASPVTIQAGSSPAALTIATVSDANTPAGSLRVGVTSLPFGLTVSNLVNNNGTVTANISTTCTLAPGPRSVGLLVSNSFGLDTTAAVTVNVTANTPPALAYNPSTVSLGTSPVITPAAAPSDNGSISSLAIQSVSPNIFTGSLSVNSAGAVSITNAGPVGTYTITVRATDNCGATADATLTITVTNPTSPSAITIQGGSPPFALASPYPSTINIDGSGLISNLTVTLSNVSHQSAPDIDILLVGPQGQSIILMSDAGFEPDNPAVFNRTLVFDDAAAGLVPQNSAITDGTFKPTNYGGSDNFPPPAPSGIQSPQPAGTATLASVFNGTNPSGAWKLYVVNDTGAFTGGIGGWSLSITTIPGPTAVELDHFTATAYDTGTFLEWRTGFEASNLGFRLYREEGGRRTLLNSQLIAGSALVASSVLSAGRRYEWWDSRPGDSQQLSYWLEDIDLSGKSTWQGPFALKRAGGPPPPESRSAMLGERGNLAALTSHPVETVAAIARPAGEPSKQQMQLAGQNAVKIIVNREGWYRVTQAELAAAGLEAKVDARTLRLFADGQEQPMRVNADGFGQFASTSSIEFYGLGLDTPATDARAYWLVVDKQPGQRIAVVKASGAPTTAASFAYTVERRDRTIYFSSLRNGERENFFGAVVTGAAVELPVSLPHLVQPAPPAVCEVALQGVTAQEHQVQIQVGGATTSQLVFDGQSATVARFNVPQAQLKDGANTIRLITQNGAGDVILVDRIRVTYQHALAADDDALKFTTVGGQAVTIGGFTAKEIRVFDVTDPGGPQELSGTVSAAAGGYAVTVVPPLRGERQLLALSESRIKSAAAVTANQSSAWQNPATAADLIILSRREFAGAIEPLKSLRESEGYKVALVDVEDIFDEFSFGNKSPQAIKDFLLFARQNWKVAPRYLLLAGDASFDPRNYLGLGNQDLVPTKLVDTSFMESASDDWLADFDGDGLAEMSVGRLPASTPAELALMVNKIISHSKAIPSEEALLVADANDDFDFETASSQLRPLFPARLQVDQINRGRMDAASAKAALLDAIKRGQKVVNYAGHGSVDAWNGRLLAEDDAKTLTNKERLSLFILMTCLNGYFHDAAQNSLSESLLKSDGGAVAVYASSALSPPEEQARMNQQFYRLLFDAGRPNRLGDVARQAKLATTSLDIRRSWTLLGDPLTQIR